MESENLRTVLAGQAQDVVMVVSNFDARWNDVTLEEAEIGTKHLIVEPDLARVQQPAVVVIGDMPSVLDLAEHVTYVGPVHTLRRTMKTSDTVQLNSDAPQPL